MNRNMFPHELVTRIAWGGVVAVVMIDQADHARPLAEALLEEGIRTVELTLRTDSALNALQIMAAEFPDLIVGAGTVLTPDQAKAVAACGVDFAVSPGVNPAVIETARQLGLAFGPGVATPSDIEQAVALDCRFLKFFPAERLGGLGYLSDIAAPYAHLDLRYLPLGGIRPDNLAAYLEHPFVAAAGGSWIAPRNAIADGNWDAIRQNARAAAARVRALRSASGSSDRDG